MKKSLIFLSMCSAALLSSCGTSSHYAYSAFEDGIYYRPDKETRQELEADRQEVQGLIEKTRQEAARFSDTIMLASINGTNSITSTAAATATPVNINVDNWYEYNLLGYDTYCSYWDWKYWDMFGPWGRYSSWADWYNWYSPWFPGIYDPWYPSYGWTWSFAWNSWGWYGPWWGGYWGGWYDPWYGPWGYPVASQPVIHYGRRDTGTSLRTGTGLTGGRLTASAGSVRQTGNTVRSANTVRNAGNVRQATSANRVSTTDKGDSHKGIQYRYRCVRKQRQDYSRRELQARGRHQLRKQIRTGRNRCQDRNGRHIVQGSKLLLQKIRCLYVGFIPQSVRGTPRHGDRKRQPQRLGSQQNGHININCQNQRLQPQRKHRIQQKHIIFIKDFQLFRDQKRIPFIVQHERKPVLQRRLAQRRRQCQKR